jgi:hypothetical protein
MDVRESTCPRNGVDDEADSKTDTSQQESECNKKVA